MLLFRRRYCPTSTILAGLLQAMMSGQIDVLILGEGNPAFSMSSQLQFSQAISRVPSVIWCGGVPDETAEFANLLLPIHHTLEDWSDFQAEPGVRTLGQPVMQPVFDSRALGDILLSAARGAGGNSR